MASLFRNTTSSFTDLAFVRPFFRLKVEAPLYYPVAKPSWKLCAFKNALQETASHDAEMSSYSHNEKRNQKHEGAYIDKDGVARTFNRKKISRKRGNFSATSV
jgi:hypothetical protein